MDNSLFASQPCDEDQRVKFQNDAFLSALRCTDPSCAGYLREHIWRGGSTPKAAGAAGAGDEDDEDEDDENGSKAAATTAASGAGDEHKSSASSALPSVVELEVTWVCCANPQHTLTDAQAKDIYQPCRKLYEDVKTEYLSYVRSLQNCIFGSC